MSPQLGPYILLEACGGDRVGTVYRAFDSVAERLVRLRVIDWPVDHPARGPALQALHGWLRLRAGRTHAHLAAVYAVAEGDLPAESGTVRTVYVAGEWVKGETLQARLSREGPVDAAVATAWTAQILSALDHLHRLGIVHADLNPATILVTDENEIRLVEAGLMADARFPWVPPTRDADGAVYLAPESLAGAATTIRSDLYATGALLQRMLGGDRLATQRVAIDALIAQATAVDPLDRFASAAEFLQTINSQATAALAPAAPSPSPLPSPSRVPPECLPPLQAAFADAVGPMADRLLQTAVGRAEDAAHLVHLLAAHIADPGGRARFVATAARFVSPAPAGDWPLAGSAIQRVAARLADEVGPMSTVLVERAASRATSRADFLQRLVESIPAVKRSAALIGQLEEQAERS